MCDFPSLPEKELVRSNRLTAKAKSTSCKTATSFFSALMCDFLSLPEKELVRSNRLTAKAKNTSCRAATSFFLMCDPL